MLKSRNYLDWINDLGTRLNLRDVSTQFISVAIATNSLVENICEMANKEVSETPTRMFLIVPPTTEISHFDLARVPSLAQHTVPRQHGPYQGMVDRRLTRLAMVTHRNHDPDRRTLHGLVWQTLSRVLCWQRDPPDLRRTRDNRGGSIENPTAGPGCREER